MRCAWFYAKHISQAVMCLDGSLTCAYFCFRLGYYMILYSTELVTSTYMYTYQHTAIYAPQRNTLTLLIPDTDCSNDQPVRLTMNHS